MADLEPRSSRVVWGSILALVVVVGAVVRYSLVPAHHAMYLDEPWYAEAACNLARSGSLKLCEETWAGRVCVPYEKAIGWPTLMAGVMKLLGCTPSLGIEINRVFGTATVPLVALTALGLGASLSQATFAAAIMAIHPVHADWSATGETNVAAAFAVLGALCGVFYSSRKRRIVYAVYGATATILAVLIRPELITVALVLAVALVFCSSLGTRSRIGLAIVLILMSAFAWLPAMSLWRMNEAISGGSFLSLTNLGAALTRLGQEDQWRIHAVVGLLGFTGALSLLGRRAFWPCAVLVGVILAAAIAVMTYERFTARMFLPVTVTAISAGGLAFSWLEDRSVGLGRICEVGALVILALLWKPHLSRLSTPSETQVLETRVVASIAQEQWPQSALFIAEQPTVLAAAGLRRVMRTRQALSDPERLKQAISHEGPVYFLSDMFCEEGFRGGGASERCEELLSGVASTDTVEVRLHSRRYALSALSLPDS